MKLLLKCFYVVSFLLLQVYLATATHIVGGELTYRCLGNNQYEISLTVFRDCYNGIPPFDNPASVGIFTQNGTYIKQLLIPFVGDDTLNHVLFDSCLVIPPTVCVHRTTYIATTTLPFLVGGYQLAYQRCCRNYTIVNIQNPDETGATFYTFISENALLQCNSNSVFKEWPPMYICAGVPIAFDHSAIDIDGDSLVYELCAPYDGGFTLNPMPQPPYSPPYDTVVWIPPYNTTNMLGGAQPLTIDRHTGQLTGTPYIIGQFVVGVCVLEYRNGQLISTTKRDFQYNIGVCGVEFVANFTLPPVICDAFTVKPLNQGSGDDYYWDFGDLSSNADTSLATNPIYTYSDTGQYVIQLIAGRGDRCSDTLTRTVNIRVNTIQPDIELTYNPCDEDTVQVTFVDQSIDPFGNIVLRKWLFNTGDTSSVIMGTMQLTGSKDYRYIVGLEVKSTTGCGTLIQDTIQTDPIRYVLGSEIPECRGDAIALNATNLDSTDVLIYEWMPSVAILEGINDSVAIVAPVQDAWFAVALENEGGCRILDSLFVTASNLGPIVQIQAIPDSLFLGQTVALFGSQGFGYQYAWGSVASLSDTASYYVTSEPTENSWYYLTVTDNNGCSATDSVFVILRAFNCGDPFIFVPNAFTPNADGKNDVLYVRSDILAELYFAVYDRWGQRVFEAESTNKGWDGTFMGSLQKPDVYGYYLRAVCADGQVYKKQGNITLLR